MQKVVENPVNHYIFENGKMMNKYIIFLKFHGFNDFTYQAIAETLIISDLALPSLHS